ncbi:MAG: hypothetical protein R3E01_24910 [Pirellulaceae bacterium]|nr:hypothetical protein [Planctomycetales bacterium]
MKDIKDTVRSHVRVAYDGSVHKTFRGTDADVRYETEKTVLQFLEERNCDFVPRVIEFDDERLYLVTTNCGQPVRSLSDGKMKSLFRELETFGVRHGDQFERNITYDPVKGRFCVIDFELADIIDENNDDDAGSECDGEESGGADEPKSDMAAEKPRQGRENSAE